MKPTIIICAAFAMFLAIIMMSGNARAEVLEEWAYPYDGEHCLSGTRNDVFDGKVALVSCISIKPMTGHMRIEVACKNKTVWLGIWIGEYMSKEGLRLRTALDGVETPAWDWEINSIDNRTLLINPAIPTIKKLLEHSRLQIRIIESRGRQHDDAIDISEFSETIAPVREICGL